MDGMTSILMLKLRWLDLPILEIILERDIKFSNEILGPVNINFNGYQIFDA